MPEKQNWTNADRICLSWTAPRDNYKQPSLPTEDKGGARRNFENPNDFA